MIAAIASDDALILRDRANSGWIEFSGMTGRKKESGHKKMLDRRTVELVLISLAAAFCGGLAWALDHELFAVAFAAAAVTGAFGAVAALMGTGRS